MNADNKIYSINVTMNGLICAGIGEMEIDS